MYNGKRIRRKVFYREFGRKSYSSNKKIKSVSKDTIPIIFIDEPELFSVKKSARMIEFILDKIKKNGGICGLHCCGKCDWKLVLSTNVDIISFDAYQYSYSIEPYAKDFEKFIKNGGIIAWGVVPTQNSDILKSISLKDVCNIFERAVKYLTKCGIDEKIIISNSIITPSCGAGGLTKCMAEKAMDLTRELSDSLKERYYGI